MEDRHKEAAGCWPVSGFWDGDEMLRKDHKVAPPCGRPDLKGREE